MKYLKNFIVVILFIITSSVFGQSKLTQCSLENLIDNVLIDKVNYKEINRNLDLTKALSYNKIDFLGFIGTNKKRLAINFEKIQLKETDPKCYIVKGYTTVLNTNLRKFEGEFNVVSHYVFSEPIDEDVDESDGNEYGFSILKYSLSENQKLSSTGVFSGDLMIVWHKNEQNQINYYLPYEGYDSSKNFQFLGSWTSYKTDKSSLCCWGIYRIPCSGDLDIGAAEFSPNKKYLQYGWKTYTP